MEPEGVFVTAATNPTPYQLDTSDLKLPLCANGCCGESCCGETGGEKENKYTYVNYLAGCEDGTCTELYTKETEGDTPGCKYITDNEEQYASSSTGQYTYYNELTGCEGAYCSGSETVSDTGDIPGCKYETTDKSTQYASVGETLWVAPI